VGESALLPLGLPLRQLGLPDPVIPPARLGWYTTLSGLSAQGTPETGGVAQPSAPDREPAVAIEKSVFPDYIVCLEDGRKLKTLKRHLMTAYGMSPEQYRARWNLPSTYPVTAPNYTEHRSKLALANGLGRKPGSLKPAPVLVQRVKAGVSGKRGRGRPRKDAA
jgi:MucR family transcriptional regulator, transcriptional regulator of exopolysaccharide biosynthesis